MGTTSNFEKIPLGRVTGDRCHIRYSAYPTGKDAGGAYSMKDKWQSGLDYISFILKADTPADEEFEKWVRFVPEVKQAIGQSTTDVMSQKAITDLLASKMPASTRYTRNFAAKSGAWVYITNGKTTSFIISQIDTDGPRLYVQDSLGNALEMENGNTIIAIFRSGGGLTMKKIDSDGVVSCKQSFADDIYLRCSDAGGTAWGVLTVWED